MSEPALEIRKLESRKLKIEKLEPLISLILVHKVALTGKWGENHAICNFIISIDLGIFSNVFSAFSACFYDFCYPLSVECYP